MKQRLNVVVTCTERKSAPVPDALALRSIPAGPVEARAAAWSRRLNKATTPRVPALELYTGNYWHVVRTLVATSVTGADVDVRFWVASAGYGLVPIDAPLHAYAATFARGDDTVGGADDTRMWWQLLASTPGPLAGHPRSLEALAAENPSVPLLVAASAAYVRAIQDDMVRAAARLESRNRLVVIAAGLKASPALRPYLVEADARFRHVVGGQMHSLNARLVQHALQNWRAWMPDGDALRQLFVTAGADLPALPSYERETQSDESVRCFIRAARREQPKVGHSTLLRRMRAEGRACEQTRFKVLFQQVINESHG